MYFYHQRHPVNRILLPLFTICLSFAVGLNCAFTRGEVILEAAILTAAVFISLTLYTFWAAWRDHDFSFLGPMLLSALMVALVFAFIQGWAVVDDPCGGGSACLQRLHHLRHDNLIKRYAYDEYTWAAVALYLDIINLFLALLMLFRVSET
ncbi:hypothetical protein HPP92_026404 [Vanilla planifolia]|uniref:Uncharacterized protein n=1 Tax=Vanilla planifolia TaxID=51239 RepID=A0A835PKF5_VANPL|nr:hypothetical protein HPP92_026404 [Vanilla planifolia]KAG0455555.1 hypothetical protein HPP92_024847 [Vanilla planifolia]